jgi:hypothetical protein
MRYLENVRSTWVSVSEKKHDSYLRPSSGLREGIQIYFSRVLEHSCSHTTIRLCNEILSIYHNDVKLDPTAVLLHHANSSNL